MEISKQLFVLVLTRMQEQMEADRRNSELVKRVFDGDVGVYDNSRLIRSLVELLQLWFPKDEDGFCELEHFIFDLDFGRAWDGHRKTIEEFWDELMVKYKHMADITMCCGVNCPVKVKCYRFLARKSELQSFFAEVPYDWELGECGMFLKAEFR